MSKQTKELARAYKRAWKQEYAKLTDEVKKKVNDKNSLLKDADVFAFVQTVIRLGEDGR